MTNTTHRLTFLAVAAALIMMTGSTVMAFPTIQMSEVIQEDWTFWGDGHNYMYASMVDFYYQSPDYFFDGVWLGTGPGVPNQLSWEHTLPADLQVPPDEVLRAKLWIDAAFVNSDGNEVQIEGLIGWDPLNNHFWDNSTFWLSDIEEQGFWNDGGINVDLAAGECFLRVDMAILMMDYQNNDGVPPGAVPEPATVGLLGLGLLGMGLYRRFRRKHPVT